MAVIILCCITQREGKRQMVTLYGAWKTTLGNLVSFKLFKNQLVLLSALVQLCYKTI